MKKQCENGHTWNMGGKCVVCGKTREDVQKDWRRKLRALEEDVPYVQPSDEDPHWGFWGNNTTGYLTDNEQK
jgi:hypothetical protein